MKTLVLMMNILVLIDKAFDSIRKVNQDTESSVF